MIADYLEVRYCVQQMNSGEKHHIHVKEYSKTKQIPQRNIVLLQKTRNLFFCKLSIKICLLSNIGKRLVEIPMAYLAKREDEIIVISCLSSHLINIVD
jgi:hypothetical protein